MPEPLPNDEIGIKLNVTSYELFRSVARAVIRYTDVPKSTDPNAGEPEPGSHAEKALDPARYYRRAHRVRTLQVTSVTSPHATMPPIVSDGHLSYLPTDPTSFTATGLATAVGGRIVRAGSDRHPRAERWIPGWSVQAKPSSR